VSPKARQVVRSVYVGFAELMAEGISTMFLKGECGGGCGNCTLHESDTKRNSSTLEALNG